MRVRVKLVRGATYSDAKRLQEQAAVESSGRLIPDGIYLHCDECGVRHRAESAELPEGWVERDGRHACPACA